METTAVEKVTIMKVNVIPELDPYHRDTRECSYTELMIDPQHRRMWVEQEYRSGSTTGDEWHHRVLTAQLEPVPHGNALHEYLESDEGQSLLARICDGHEIVWDGSNMVGRQNEDSRSAWYELMVALADLPDSDWSFWETDEWLHPGAEQEITAETTDEQLQALAQEYETAAQQEHVVLHAPAIEYLTEYRDRLRWEADYD